MRSPWRPSIGFLLLSFSIAAVVACSDSTLDSSSAEDESGVSTTDLSLSDTVGDTAQADESVADTNQDESTTDSVEDGGEPDEVADTSGDESTPDESTPDESTPDESEDTAEDVGEETVEDVAHDTAEDVTEDPEGSDVGDVTRDTPPCFARANRCASRAVEACQDTVWVETSVCESDQLCTGQGWCEDIPDYYGMACRGEVTAQCNDTEDGYDFSCMGPEAILHCRSFNPILAEEGDECITAIDCPRSGGFLCSRPGYCQDGSVGDRCYSADDCTEDRVCLCPTSGVRCEQWERTCQEPG